MNVKNGKDNKLIVWDIDGTLIHCGSCGRNALNTTFKEMYNIERAFDNAKIGGSCDGVIVDEILSYYNLPKNEIINIKEKYSQILNVTLVEYDNNIVLPGIVNILEFINNSDSLYNALSTSNFKIGAKEKLEANDLERFFEAGGYGDSVTNKTEVLFNAIESAEKVYGKEFRKENIFVIGDTVHDIKSAEGLRVKSIAVATGYSQYEELEKAKPDYSFKDFKEYEKLIEIINK